MQTYFFLCQFPISDFQFASLKRSGVGEEEVNQLAHSQGKGGFQLPAKQDCLTTSKRHHKKTNKQTNKQDCVTTSKKHQNENKKIFLAKIIMEF